MTLTDCLWLQEAEHAALRAVEINPSNVGAVMALGVQRKKLGELQRLSPCFLSSCSVKHRPFSPCVSERIDLNRPKLTKLCVSDDQMMRTDTGKWEEAAADFSKASGLGPAIEEHKMLINHWGQTLTWAG